MASDQVSKHSISPQPQPDAQKDDLVTVHEKLELSGTTDAEYGQGQITYVTGIRFWLITIAISIALFLTNLEIPIVTTSLVAITGDLGGFDKVGWLISSYLLGYVGVLVIFAKLSDIFGRKFVLALSLSIFVIASAACGAAQTLIQLIVFRAFQGIGGGGCYALGTTMITDLVPPSKFAQFGANMALVYAVSLLVGPILGGAISRDTTWRWIFLINIPAAVPALLITFMAIPKGFPFQGNQNRPKRTFISLLGKDTREKLDVVGAALLLLATLTLTAGFEEAGGRFPWKSAYVITLLTSSGLLWIALFIWERRITLRANAKEPVLPWTFVTNRSVVGVLLNSTFLGGTWFVTIFQLPQKFQLVHGVSPLQAGIRLMPFTFAAPLGAMVASSVAGKAKVPPIFCVFSSAIFQVIGFALLSTLPETKDIPARTYGYQVIAGFGCGINISILLVMIPFFVDFKHRAVGMGAVGQVRVMGGAIVLSIAISVFNSYTRPRLANILGDSGVEFVTLSTIPAELHDEVRRVLAHGYNLQMYVLCAFAAAQIPATLLLWRKKQLVV